MNRKSAIPVVAAIAATFLLATVALAEEKGIDWKVLEGAKVSLEKGLAAAQQKGKPISGKFEMEYGKLQLSVYTASQGKFWEVIVDHASGKVSKTEEIKEGEDLSAAKAQSEAMAKAKKSLSSAVQKAAASNAGYRAVSVVPTLEQGKPVATVVLQNATGSKTVSKSLD
ncbi:MAG TPA: PepSY domain-containing protein [Thermoanaerobaculia bacterium]|nr:PepSY domain-containing protein [Thermoanaerobaculia bacterium]